MSDKETIIPSHHDAKFQLREAIQELAVGEKDVRFRLCQAHYNLMKIDENLLPQELQADFNWIIKSMTKEEPRYIGEKMILNSVENTMRSIHNTTGSKIAERIFNLYLKLQDY